VLKSVLIPVAISVEDEFLVGLGAPEDHALVEGAIAPHQIIRDERLLRLLQTLDVHVVEMGSSEERQLVEHHLLFVSEQLSVEDEVVSLHPSAGNGRKGHTGRDQEGRVAGHQEVDGPHSNGQEISQVPPQSISGLGAPIQEEGLGVLIVLSLIVGVDGREGRVREGDGSKELKEEAILEEAVSSELVVSGELVGLIVLKVNVSSINGEPSIHPGIELIVPCPVLGDLVVEMVLIGDRHLGVGRLGGQGLAGGGSSSTKVTDSDSLRSMRLRDLQIELGGFSWRA